MPIPVVTCNADVIKRPDEASPIAIVLGATATNGPITAWQWTMLSVPTGSTIDVGVNGDFTNGVATIQNPTFNFPADEQGTCVLQAIATNSTGPSDPLVDKESAQQLAIVLTDRRLLAQPNDYAYDWGKKYLLPLIRRFEKFVGGHTNVRYWSRTENYNTIYVDGTTGDDDNDGLGWGTALKTIDTAWTEHIPNLVSERYMIIFRGAGIGSSGELGGWFADKRLTDNGHIIFSGENTQNVTSGPFTTTGLAADKFKILQTGAGWTVNQHAGKWVKINDGAQAGRIRLVLKNTIDTLDVSVAYGAAIAGSVSFSFVEPSSSYNGYFGVTVTGDPQSAGVRFQNFKNTGGAFLDFSGSGACRVTSVMSVGGFSSVAGNSGTGSLRTELSWGAQTSFPFGSDSNLAAGVYFPNPILVSGGRLNIRGALIGGSTDLYNCLYADLGGSFNSFRSRYAPTAGTYAIFAQLCRGLVLTEFEVDASGLSGGNAFEILNSIAVFRQSNNISNSPGHGLYVHGSRIAIVEDLSGSGNTLFGVYPRHESVVRILDGSAPTITGTSGDVTVLGGSSTWAAIDGGTPLIDATDGTRVYEDDATSIVKG